jgi:hypothetical protein
LGPSLVVPWNFARWQGQTLHLSTGSTALVVSVVVVAAWNGSAAGGGVLPFFKLDTVRSSRGGPARAGWSMYLRQAHYGAARTPRPTVAGILVHSSNLGI